MGFYDQYEYIEAASSLRIVAEEEVEFDSAKGIEEVDDAAAGLDDFDRRLREAEGERA